MSRARTARVYTPPPEAAAYPASHHHDEDGGGKSQPLIFVIMLIVILAGGYVLWTIYGGKPVADAPVIVAQDGGFKQRYEGPPVDELATTEIDRALEGRAPPPVKAVPAPRTAPEPIAPIVPQTATAAVKGPAPQVTGAGGFLVQIAALRSEGAADTAWDRLARRDPALFAIARKDVQRADLGGKGVYYRVRAGYFAERAEAARFCDRVKTLGQECIVVVR